MILLEDLARIEADDRTREAAFAARRNNRAAARPCRPARAYESVRSTEGRTMTTTRNAAKDSYRSSRTWCFIRHYLEMVVAMAVGMVALAPVWSWATDALGASALLDRPDIGALVMATNMTIAMSAWMRYRRHGWAPIAEMGAAMYLPFLALFVPLWTGAISAETLMIAGHLLMLPAMAVVMLFRLDEYTTHTHHGQPMPDQADHAHRP
jgi:hypothetical protein